MAGDQFYDEDGNLRPRQEETQSNVKAEKRFYDQVKKSVDESSFLISDENFKLPDMGDYYNTAVDDPYIKMVDEAIRNVKNGDEHKASFYLEEPYVTQLGSHDLEGVYFIKAKPVLTEEADTYGYYDGDTLYFSKSSITADTDTINRITSSLTTALEDLNRDMSNEEIDDFRDFGIRFLGMDAPEIPKYSIEFVDMNDENTTAIPRSEAIKRQEDLYVFERGVTPPSGEDPLVHFIHVGGVWKQYSIEKDKDEKNKTRIKVLQVEGESNPEKLAAALKAKRLVKDLITKAGGEVYLMIDRTSLNRSNENYPSRYGVNAFSTGVIEKVQYWWQQIRDYNPYRYAGYKQWGQDTYGRFLGTPYVKITDSTGTKWINLAKYIIAEVPEVTVLPDYTDSPLFQDNTGFASKIFKLHTYDYNNRVVADAATTLADILDDRRKIQRDIFGRDFDALKEWTVTIGDTTLFVPPTSIRAVTNTTQERIPVIRAKGSMTKGALKEERLLEMSIYFNDDRGINGYEYETELPNGEKITYHMNGLRSLISQFKFTPFLPIDNHYINEILNIDAITLVNLQISTLPDYPKCIVANLTLQEFDYLQYMPELPINLDEDDKYRNPFAGTINYEVLRWYYQKAILLGEELKNVDSNSQKYLEATEGHRTALLPMNFQNPNVRFMIANEEHLKKMLQVKLDMIRSPFARIVLSDIEKEVARDIGMVYASLSEMLGNEEFQQKLNAINVPPGPTESNVNRIVSVYKSTGMFSNIPETVAGIQVDPIREMDFRYFDEIRHDDGTIEYKQAGKIDNQIIIDFLESIRLHITKANTLAGKTIVSAGVLKYEEEDIKQVSKKDTTGKHSITKEKDIIDGRVLMGVEFTIQLDYLTNPDQINDLRRDASLTTQLNMDDVFTEYKLFIPFYGAFQRDKNISGMPYSILSEAQNFKIDTSHPDVQFISYCHSIATTLGLNDDMTMSEEAMALKQDSDMNSLDTVTYEDYDMGDIRIKSLSCGFGNTFTRIGLSGTAGYAPQYIGGQDTVIEVGIETTDPYAVGMISALPRISTQYARDYRLILPSSPVKIDSEITKLLGVNEVVIENVDISTVDGQPGLYEISMRLVSMDRTLRNREGLKKINEFALSGRNTTEEKTDRQLQTYFELNKALAQAELYPDLELPRLDELQDIGFEFIRHKFEDYRVYPDPDFYFVYGHVLQSQIFRESVQNFHHEAMNEMLWTDETGEEVKTLTKKEVGVEINGTNETADRHKEIKEGTEEVADQMNEEANLLKSHMGIINTLRAADITSAWNISEDIRAVFLEPAYLSLLEYHKNLAKGPLEGEEALDASAGQWVYDAMEPARKASKAIGDYLNKPLGEPGDLAIKKGPVTFYNLVPEVKDSADAKIDGLLKDNSVENIFDLLEIKVNRKFKKALKNIMWAAACAATSEKEYTGKKNESAWKPNKNFIGMRVVNDQDSAEVTAANTSEEIVEQGIEFGAYRIKMFSSDELKKITGKSPSKLFSNETKQNINKSYFLLDPYYRRPNTTLAEIEEYKKNCVESIAYATEAFFRNMLFWLKKMIDDDILPNMSMDVLKNEFEKELAAAYYEASTLDEDAREAMSEIRKYGEFLSKSERAVDGGKMFAAAVMAMTNSDAFYEPMRAREYEMLNGMVESAMSISGDHNPTDMDYILLRKMLLALVGLGEIKKETDIGKQAENPTSDFKKALNEKKYIEAAEDPNQYIQHSFYDMVANDKRGRMAKAFPTFYLVFLDEGREIGLWKLHDNFYNINAISEIQVSKSRKNPADTCRIVLSNLFHTLTTDDEDSNMVHEYDYRDVFTSIFNPRSYYLKEEAKRLKQQPISKAKLTAGTRIHVRMGYGSNAAALPVLFNGSIAEVGAGDAVEIIAQGDGIELLNPNLNETEAHKVENQDKNPISKLVSNLFSTASTPKTIIDAFLSAEQGFIAKKVKELSGGFFYSEHPLGITHFGDPKYNVVFNAGEPTQNIYEAISKPKWADLGKSISSDYSMKEAPKLSIDVYGKTFWDILNICVSASPDFILGVAPFGFRSTIFHGHPRYYYAYEYYQDSDGTILERRKPYQQYHILTSHSDIIKNDIRASSQNIKTSAVGMYELRSGGGSSKQKNTGYLWVDKDIYPEFQKSMIYDTQLLSKGVPVLGSLVPRIGPAINWVTDNTSDDEGDLQSGKAVAWRMTAHALKQSILDMYQGEIIITGDPSIKPHDRLYIYDAFEDMSGSILAEGVVQNFSSENGFTTTIYPDCIAVVDDRHELAVQSTAGQVVGRAITAQLAVMTPSLLFGKTFSPLLTMTGKRSVKMLMSAARVLRDAGRMKEAVKLAQTARKTRNLYKSGRIAAVAGGAVVGSGGTALVPLLGLALEIAIVQTMSNLAYSAIERWMKSQQVLQIFPVKKHRRVLTSGLNGSMGLVYGSPTYDTPGTLETLFTKLNTETNGFNKAINFVIDMLASPEMKNIAARYERGQNITGESGDTIVEEKAIDKMLKSLASSESRTQSGYRKLLLSPRITPEDDDYDDRLDHLFDSKAFLDTNGIEVQPRITNEMIYVKQDEKLNEAIETGLLQLAWDAALPENVYETKEFFLSGKTEHIRAITIDHNNKKLYDIPFLKADAAHVLREIIIKCSFLLPEHDPTSNKTPENFVMLHSALKVGDDETYSSLGYSFVLEAIGPKRRTLLLDSIRAIEKEVEELYNIGEFTNKKIFEWSTDTNDQGEESFILLTVYPALEE